MGERTNTLGVPSFPVASSQCSGLWIGGGEVRSVRRCPSPKALSWVVSDADGGVTHVTAASSAKSPDIQQGQVVTNTILVPAVEYASSRTVRARGTIERHAPVICRGFHRQIAFVKTPARSRFHHAPLTARSARVVK